MKIYIKNSIPKQINLTSINATKSTFQEIYSSDGIFRIQNNNISKLIPQDVASENFNYNNIEFIIDKSSYLFRKNIYTIQYEHINYNIEQYEYKLHNNSLASMVVQYHKNKIFNLYFYTKFNLCDNLKINILEYISLFNDIKQS